MCKFFRPYTTLLKTTYYQTLSSHFSPFKILIFRSYPSITLSSKDFFREDYKKIARDS
jgi:hypothetical protein